jgi:hypothetical protein
LIISPSFLGAAVVAFTFNFPLPGFSVVVLCDVVFELFTAEIFIKILIMQLLYAPSFFGSLVAGAEVLVLIFPLTVVFAVVSAKHANLNDYEQSVVLF